MNDHQPIAIVGFGARTAAGWNTVTNAASVSSHFACFTEHPYLVDKGGNTMVVSMVPDLSDSLQGCDRFVALADQAMTEATGALRRVDDKSLVGELVLGLPSPRDGLPSDLEQQLGQRLAVACSWLRIRQVHTFTTGHAAGLMALQHAGHRIAAGEIDWCLVGGVDSYLYRDTLESLDAQDQLHSNTTTWGYVPGEAAGFCLLMSAAMVEHWQLSVLCEITAASTSREENCIYTDTVCTGTGLTEVITNVAQFLGDASFDEVWCDQNGERYRAAEFGFASLRVRPYIDDPSRIHAPARCWGDVGAASGPLLVAVATTLKRQSCATASTALVWTSSVTGERSAAALHIPPGLRAA